MLLLSTAWACETGLPSETKIPELWDSAVPVSCRTREYTVHSSTPYCGSEERVSVSRCYISTFGSTGGPEGPECGSGSGTGLTGWDF